MSTDIVKTGRILFFCLFVCFYLITQRSWMKPLLRNNICPWLWSIVMCVCAELIFTFDYVIARPSGHWVPPGACLNDITTLSFMCLKKIRSKKCPPFFLAPLSYATFFSSVQPVEQVRLVHYAVFTMWGIKLARNHNITCVQCPQCVSTLDR